MLEDVLADDQVTARGPQARGIGEKLADKVHARLVAESLLEHVRTALIRLDEQQGLRSSPEDPLGERADPGSDLGDVAPHVL